MNHYTWTYVAGEGKNYQVGLFHGNKSGHVLIYCNSNIITIDFKVFESKKYSFFINDELCEIHLDRKGDEMYYHFEIDKKTDTPRNRARHQMERRHLRQLLIGVAVFAAIVTAASLLMYFHHPDQNTAEKLLAQKGKETVGKIFIRPRTPEPEISYEFVANNQGFAAYPSIQTKPFIISKNGMPLESGDEFVVHYVSSDPEINRIDFNRPTERQLKLYSQRAAEKYARLHPDESPHTIDCMVKVAFELKGIAGLADFYFQDFPPEKNSDHNEHTFLRLTRDLPFQKKVKEECW